MSPWLPEGPDWQKTSCSNFGVKAGSSHYRRTMIITLRKTGVVAGLCTIPPGIWEDEEKPAALPSCCV